jgi:hypothetical protein
MKKYPWLEEMLIDYHNQSVKGKHNLDLGTVQFEYMISSTSQEEFREFMDSVTVAKHWQIVKKKESVYVIQKDFNETDSYHQSKQLTIELVQEDQKVKCFID